MSLFQFSDLFQDCDSRISRIHPYFAKTCHSFFKIIFQQNLQPFSFSLICRCYDNGDCQSESIDRYMPFTPFDFLSAVNTDSAPLNTAFDTLTVNTACGRLNFSPLSFSLFFAKNIHNFFPYPLFCLSAEISVNRIFQ